MRQDFIERPAPAPQRAKAVDQSPRLGLKSLPGFIFAHNDPSLQLFEKFGFQRWGVLTRVTELDGVERNLIIVGRHPA
jgi:L-amino acid N-acyltransferase YncA